MAPFAVMMGNVLLTIWIVGGFLLLLVMSREEPELKTTALPAAPTPSVGQMRPVAPAEPIQPVQADPDFDLLWRRRTERGGSHQEAA